MLLDARAQFTDLFRGQNVVCVFGFVTMHDELVAEGNNTQWVHPSTRNRSVDLPLDGGSIPYAKHLTECPSCGQKGLFSLDNGSFESLVESVKLEIRGFEKVALKQFCAQAPW